jgi:hypothetical protein
MLKLIDKSEQRISKRNKVNTNSNKIAGKRAKYKPSAQDKKLDKEFALRNEELEKKINSRKIVRIDGLTENFDN